jgi:signal transduction histidine kinase
VESGGKQPLDISLRSENALAVLSVQHRGVTQVEEHQRLFQPLQPLDPEHHSHGLGVGLYVSRELVQALGGTVDVATTPSAGTSLCVRLPTQSP